ncbi:MAG: hypothetical protein ACR2QZ_02170, partial [Woeseiaceae bacterium]
SVALLKELSGGIARIANNLVESSLAAAAAKGIDRIPATLIAQVAFDEYGLSADDFVFDAPPPESPVVSESAEPDVDLNDDSVAAEDSEQIEELESQTAAVDVDVEDEPLGSDADAPHLIHDTLPNLEVLSPNYAEFSRNSVDDPVAEDADPVGDNVAELIPEAVAEDSDEPVPEPEPEAFAELIPEPEPAPDVVEDIVPELLPEPVQRVADDIDPLPALQPEPLGEITPEIVSTPELAKADVAIPETLVEHAAEPIADSVPELTREPEPAPELVADDIPELVAEPVEVVVDDVDPLPELHPEALGEITSDFNSSPELEQAEMSIPEPIVELTAEAVAESVPELIPEPTAEPMADSIPELVPEPTAEPIANSVPERVLESEPAEEPVAEVIPELVPEAALMPESADLTDVEEWDREPTLAELKPDLEALEQAMAFAQGGSVKKAEDAPADGGSLYDRVTLCEEMPEITLDKTIETGIEKIETGEADDSQSQTPLKKSAVELDKIAAEIGMASTLEDFDDKMAETLFGTGISMIAAQLTIKQPTKEPANDDIELSLDEPTPASPPVAKAPQTAPSVTAAPQEVTLESAGSVSSGALLPTATQRLKTVRALNAEPNPASRKARPAPGASRAAEAGAPAPIEDQINTSITQTLEALQIPEDPQDDASEAEPKRGFFSRFRRS